MERRHRDKLSNGGVDLCRKQSYATVHLGAKRSTVRQDSGRMS